MFVFDPEYDYLFNHDTGFGLVDKTGIFVWKDTLETARKKRKVQVALWARPRALMQREVR